MEAAPLTLAQTHARNAVLETKRANPVAASEEHDLAAAEYSTAAQSTNDSEAGRILYLLEQHHKRLGQLLKGHHTVPAREEPHAATLEQDKSKTLSQPSTDVGRSISPETTSQPPRLVRTGRPSARDLSSSIASNLASARGIPSNRQKRSAPISPLVSNQHADGRFSQDDDRVISQSSHNVLQNQSVRSPISTASHRPSWAPPADVNDGISSRSGNAQSTPAASDVPFQQFYSTFESLMSKLSAPLAFAGLPLTTPTPPATSSDMPPPKVPASKITQSLPTKALDASVNYSQLISRAALRAVSRNDKSSPYGNGSESFYVVPTTGGTTSYAEIMTRADREASHHRRNTSNLSAGTADEFEDASSTILPTPLAPPSRPGLSNERKYNGKTMEELSLENKALKHLSDTLSKRLHAFEMSAQTSSAALAQSIRSLHLSPLTTPENSRGKSNVTTAFNMETTQAQPPSSSSSNSAAETAKLQSRITELETILRKSDAKARRRDDENAKLRDTLGKYRDKWDSLKAGAKARRERAVVGDAAATTTITATTTGKGKDREKSSSDNGTGGTTETDDPDGDVASLAH